MGKIKRYRLASKLLKIQEFEGKLRCVLYKFVWDTSVSPNKFELKRQDVEPFITDNESSALWHFGMDGASIVTSDNLINVHHRVIWTNNDFEEWAAVMMEDGEDEDTLTHSRYNDERDNDLWDERANLDVEVDGVIVAFADLGLWDGHHNGAKKFGNNVKNILKSSNDYQDWYCDLHNVRCTDIHHDGTNEYLYRVARDNEQANYLVNAIAYEGMTEEQFRKATKSLRPYVAKVYGW